jgi:predicted HAD superfamily Cof-like phosphohydrolase
MVKEFHEKFGVPIGGPGFLLSEKRALLRVRLNQEENAELTEAIQMEDYVAMAKEAADVLYVVVGMCVEAGIPIEEVFEEVHRSNMTKTGDKDVGGKVTKGADYKAPNIALTLAERVLADNPNTPKWRGR